MQYGRNMKKILAITLFMIIFVGCADGKKQATLIEYTEIPSLKNNFENGEYKSTNKYPQLSVLLSYCAESEYIYFGTNWQKCMKLKDINEKLDVKKLNEVSYIPSIDDDITITVREERDKYVPQGLVHGFEGKVEKSKKEFLNMLKEVEIISYIPPYFRVVYDEEGNTSANFGVMMSFNYKAKESNDFYYSVEIDQEQYSDHHYGYITVTKISNLKGSGPIESEILIHAYIQMDSVVEKIGQLKQSGDYTEF